MKAKTLAYFPVIASTVLIILGCAITPETATADDIKTEKLFAAVNRGDYSKVKRLIEAGADVNAQNSEGNTPLIWASFFGFTEVARLLIEAGAEVNAVNVEGLTALMGASATGHAEFASLLIDAGADVNAQSTKSEATALMFASLYGRIKVAQLLIDERADVNTRDRHGQTALMFAIVPIEGVLDIVKYFVTLMLIESGADINAQSQVGNTALINASKYGYSGIAELLIERGAGVNIKDSDGRTALIHASINGHTEIANLLKQAGADVKVKDNQGLTADVYSALSALSSVYKTKADVEGCIKIEDSEWKQGSEKVVVRTIDIDFSMIEVDYTISESEREYYEKEKYTQDQIRQSKKHEAYEQVLWDTFANKCEEDQFGHITTENWYEKWSFYKHTLIEKANESSLSGDLLRKCIEKIEPKPNDKLALLPVGAYLAKNGNEEVWIIICKWEYAREYENDDGTKGFHTLGHIRGWAVTEKDQTIVAFFTCT